MNQTDFNTFAGQSRSSLERKGSRFIGFGFPLESRDEFDHRREKLVEEFPKATHIVSASVILESDRPVERYDSDGEPSGTAGEPILGVLKGEDLVNAAIFAVRYFGGTELGTGGLVRAYSDTARGVIDAASIINRRKRREYLVSFPYSFTGKVAETLSGFGEVEVIARDFGQKPTLTLSVPVNDEDRLLDRLREVTSGSVDLTREEPDKEED